MYEGNTSEVYLELMVYTFTNHYQKSFEIRNVTVTNILTVIIIILKRSILYVQQWQNHLKMRTEDLVESACPILKYGTEGNEKNPICHNGIV